MRYSRRGVAPTLLVAAFTLATAGAGHACSVCRCGDPTFNSLGTELFTAGSFQLAFDVDSLEKEQGGGGTAEEPGSPARAPIEEGDDGGLESLQERRWTLTLSYAFNERFQGVARLPWSHRELAEGAERTTASGRADPEIYGLVRVWSAPWTGQLGRRGWVSLLAGVKTDWGENDLGGGGERFDEHVQAGTGSTDPFAGVTAVYLLDPRSTVYGSVQVRRPGRNDAGYRYGDVALANLGYEHKLGDRFDASLEANFRAAGRDEIDRGGTSDANTGGAILFLSPRLLVDLGRRLVARVAVQVPVLDDLNGEQEEKPVFNVGVTTSF